MQPQYFSALRNQRRARELQHVAVFLEASLNADRTSGCLRRGTAPAAFRGGKQDPAPARSLQTHGAVAFALRIRNANRLDAVAAAESRHLLAVSLHHAPHADPALLELCQRLAQLRERFRIERSAKMPQPENHRRAIRPQLREPVRFSKSKRVGEVRSGIAYRWFARHPDSLRSLIVTQAPHPLRSLPEWPH